MKNNNVVVNGVKYFVELNLSGESKIYDENGNCINAQITTGEYFDILTTFKSNKAKDQDDNELEIGNLVVNTEDNAEYEVIEILADNKIRIDNINFIKPELIIINASNSFVMTDDEGERYTREQYYDTIQ